jgi:hypothetical protein
LAGWCVDSYAADAGIVVLRQGLLGAGTGAAATAATGGRGDAVWKGALIGMGVSVVGGAIIDILTQPSGNGAAAHISRPRPLTRYVIVDRPAARPDSYATRAQRIYKAGYRAGYSQGYRDGYDDAAYYMAAY